MQMTFIHAHFRHTVFFFYRKLNTDVLTAHTSDLELLKNVKIYA